MNTGLSGSLPGDLQLLGQFFPPRGFSLTAWEALSPLQMLFLLPHFPFPRASPLAAPSSQLLCWWGDARRAFSRGLPCFCVISFPLSGLLCKLI